MPTHYNFLPYPLFSSLVCYTTSGGNIMGLRDQLERKIQAKNQDIARLENEVREARSYIQGLQDALKMLPRDRDPAGLSKILRAGSDMAKTREFILKEGIPKHIDDILKALGKGKDQKASISGSLGNYV